MTSDSLRETVRTNVQMNGGDNWMNVLCTYDGAERFAHGAVHLEREVQCSLIEEKNEEKLRVKERMVLRQTDRQANTLTATYSYIHTYNQ